ncbi:MAG: hypothetical protein Q8N44_05795 [Rubrivivax sp.]|nr:hypothetical protein [Rubrivivax sp.]
MSSSDRARRRWLTAGAALAAASLAGCGFRLRRPPQMRFERVALTGFAPFSPLAAELRRQLLPGVRVVDDLATAQVVVHALADTRERSVVASTAAAQVRELQLRVKLHVRAAAPGGRELMAAVELRQSRDLSYSETAALAKQHEEAALFREMEADVALQLLQRLAAIQP